MSLPKSGVRISRSENASRWYQSHVEGTRGKMIVPEPPRRKPRILANDAFSDGAKHVKDSNRSSERLIGREFRPSKAQS